MFLLHRRISADRSSFSKPSVKLHRVEFEPETGTGLTTHLINSTWYSLSLAISTPSNHTVHIR